MSKNHIWFNLLDDGVAGSSNNSYVQGVLNVSSDSPSAGTITALNTFFDSIDSLMSEAEMIKIYALNNNSLTDFQLYNFVNPAIYKSVPVSTPTYAVKGYISAGAGYLDGGIPANRRALIGDFSSLGYGMDASTTFDNTALWGANPGVLGLLRPLISATLGEGYPYNNSSTSFTNTDCKGMFWLRNIDATLSKSGKNATESTSSRTTVNPSTGVNITDLCWVSSGTPSNIMIKSHLGFRWEGHELSVANIETIRTAFETYLSSIGL
jgi:hypothetical protein